MWPELTWSRPGCRGSESSELGSCWVTLWGFWLLSPVGSVWERGASSSVLGSGGPLVSLPYF